MAGHAHHFAHITHAAIDGAHYAQGQVHFIEHRALLNMDFNETHIVLRLALNVGNLVFIQARVFHGFAHGNAIGISLR